MPNTVFDVLDTDANVALSGGNLTATAGAVSGDGGTRGADPKTSGTTYIEWTCGGGFAGGDTGVGFCSNGHSWAELGANAIESFIVFANGQIYCNGSNTGVNIGALASHTVCGVLDLTNNRAYFRRDGGNWNNNGAANPTTNTGGIDISGVPAGAPWVPIILFTNSSSGAATANFGDTTFAQSVPSGITSGWAANTPTAGVALDPGSTDSGITLLNSNYTAKFNTAGADRAALAIPSIGASQKVCFELFVNAAGTSTNNGCGAAGTGATPSNVISSGLNAALLFISGSVVVNNVLVSSFHALGSFASGHTTMVAIDTGANLYWTRKTGNGQWNDGGTANPATGVGGYSIGSGALVLPIGPCITLGDGASTGTISLNSSSIPKTQPVSGFTFGVTAGSPPATVARNSLVTVVN